MSTLKKKHVGGLIFGSEYGYLFCRKEKEDEKRGEPGGRHGSHS